MDDILCSMEEDKVTTLIALDLSVYLIWSITQYCSKFSRRNLEWRANVCHGLTCFPRPRHCKVNIESTYSLEHELQCSNTQGSCAGPVTYLAYASLLQEVIPLDIPLHGFADDDSVKKAFRGGMQNNNEEKKTIEDLENGAKNQDLDGYQQT